MPVNTRLRVRRGSSSDWNTAGFPTLENGELGLDTTLKRLKVGDGTTTWDDLPWSTFPLSGIGFASDALPFQAGSGIGVDLIYDSNGVPSGLTIQNNIVAGSNITFTEVDGTITIAGSSPTTVSQGTGIVVVQAGDDYTINAVYTHQSFIDAVDARVSAGTISDEAVRDVMATGITGGTGILVTYDDDGDQLIHINTTGLAYEDHKHTLVDITDVGATAAEVNVLSGVVPGTVSSGDAVVVDGNKDIGDFNQVTATTFIGDLSGNADTASQVKTQQGNTDANYYITFVDSDNGSATAETVYTDAGLVYNPSTNNLNLGNNLVVGGNLTVQGTTTTVNSTTVDIGDNIIQVNVSGAETLGGIQVYDHDNSLTQQLVWDITDGRWEFINVEGTDSPDVYTSGTLTAAFLAGDGSAITNIDFDNIATNIPDPRISGVLTGDVTGTSSVVLTDLGDGTITINTDIAAGAVDTLELADGAVTSDKIENGTIVNEDISDTAAIIVSKLASSGITIGSTEYILGDSTTSLSGMTLLAGTSPASQVEIKYAIVDGGTP